MMELLIVVVIIGIIATAVLPSFSRSFEIAKGRESETSLRTIYEAERAYYFDRTPNRYGTLDDLVPTYLPSTASLNTANWTYGVAPSNPASGPAAFVATATRQGGPHNGQTRTMNQSGTLAPASWPP